MIRYNWVVPLISATLLFLSISTSVFLGGPAQAAMPAVSVVPSSLVTEVGQTFSIDIAVSDVFNLYGWEFKLGWNPYLCSVAGVAEGPFLQGDGLSTFFTCNISSADGLMIVDCTLLEWIPGVSGNGILSTVIFYTGNLGECPLYLYDVLLIDSFEQPISCQTFDGYLRAISPHDVAVTTVDVSPLIIVLGNSVSINLSVQNQGSHAEVFEVTAYVNSTVVGIQQASVNVGSSTNVSFTWNTTAYAKGDYLVLATVGPVAGEIDLSDNTKTADSLVTILTLGHDVVVLAIEPTKTVIGQNYDLNVLVKVGIYGVYNETFNVTVYINTTVLGFQTVTLSSGTKADILFVTSSSSFLKGNYTLNASASLVSGESEIDDNTLADGWVIITIPGDIQGDFVVDIYDALLLSGSFNSVPTSTNWNPNTDINDDGIVDIYDALILSSHFNHHFP